MLLFPDATLNVEYEPFAILIGPGRKGHYPIQVLESPAGEGGALTDELVLPERVHYLDRMLRGMSRQALRRGQPPGGGSSSRPSRAGLDRAAQALGTALFRALFRGEVEILLERSLEACERTRGAGLRIELRADPRLRSLAPVLRAPWELLYHPRLHQYLCLERTSPVVRSLLIGRPRSPAELQLPLRLLSVLSNTDPVRRLKLEREYRKLEASLRGIAKIEALAKPTWPALRDALRDGHYDVLHFMGHGGFDPSSGMGFLVLENETRGADAVDARRIAEAASGAQRLSLVVLNACESGASGSGESLHPFAGVATALVGRGIPAVVAMQYPISDSSAILFSTVFYERLAAEDPVEAAVTEARLALEQDRGSAAWTWPTPVVFLRRPSPRLLGRERPVARRGPGAWLPPGIVRWPRLGGPIDYQPLIRHHSIDFQGRKKPFEQIEEWRRSPRGAYVMVSAAAGSGKTAFLAELVRRTGCMHHFDLLTEGLSGREPLLRNLGAQLIQRTGVEDWSLANTPRDADTFARLLHLASRRFARDFEEIVAIDLVQRQAQPTAIPSVEALGLPSELPSGFLFVLALSSETELVSAHCDVHRLTLDESPEHWDDLRDYVSSMLARGSMRAYAVEQGLAVRDLITRLTEHSRGSFLYINLLADELDRGRLFDLNLGELPLGLDAYFAWKWATVRNHESVSWRDEALPVLVALIRKSSPLLLDELAELAGIASVARAAEIVRLWSPCIRRGSLVRRTRGPNLLVLAHDHLLDWIALRETSEEERENFRNARITIDENLRR